MEPSRNLTPQRGPSVWDAPPAPSPYWTLATVAGVILGAALAWRYRLVGRAVVTKSIGVGGMVLGVATSPAGRKVANLLIERLAAARRPESDIVVDTALEHSFPASDPSALSYQ